MFAGNDADGSAQSVGDQSTTAMPGDQLLELGPRDTFAPGCATPARPGGTVVQDWVRGLRPRAPGPPRGALRHRAESRSGKEHKSGAPPRTPAYGCIAAVHPDARPCGGCPPRARASAGNGRGSGRAGASAKVAPFWAEARRARRADARRLSPLPAGRRLPAVTRSPAPR
jgi:hypothetical protein